jgi:hypothetical protein
MADNKRKHPPINAMRWVMTAPLVVLHETESDYAARYPQSVPNSPGWTLKLYQHFLRHQSRIEQQAAARG